jgi:hypothetical protein
MTTPTDEDVIVSIAEVMRSCHVAAVPNAFRIVVERLRQHYGRRNVDRALRGTRAGCGRRTGASSGRCGKRGRRGLSEPGCEGWLLSA